MTKRIALTAILFVLLLGCSPANGSSSPVEVPLVANPRFWASVDGHPTVDCAFDACFPKSATASASCDPRCLFTTKGYGAPEAQLRAFSGKTPAPSSRKAHFVVAYGPPASGKGSILPVLQRELAAELGDLEKSTVSVNVDDIFQGGEVGDRYKQYRQSLIAAAPADRRTLYTQRLYVFFRWIGDQVSDGIFNQALAGRYDVLWETTGASTWPRREVGRINSYGYDSVVVYPLVETEKLIERAAKRAEEEGQEGAPPEQIRATVTAAQANLVQLLPSASGLQRDPCPAGEMFGGDPEGCRAKRVILIDNTGAKGSEKVAWDSRNPGAHCAEQKALDDKVRLLDGLRAALKASSSCAS